jgi:DNA polymerase-3 subunit alpha
VVIAPSELTDFSPLYCDSEGDGLVTQFDKNDVEDVGLVKFDFLGLRTLTIIDWAMKHHQRHPRGRARIRWISIASPWTTRRPSSC